MIHSTVDYLKAPYHLQWLFGKELNLKMTDGKWRRI